MEKRLLMAVGVVTVLAVAFLAAFLAIILLRTSPDNADGKKNYNAGMIDIQYSSENFLISYRSKSLSARLMALKRAVAFESSEYLYVIKSEMR
ncbi:jg11555 [Pararge aegeria aegeria]|uniref:Jg11555 protein n=1 Tax=Pararge aegeria aegeria TaxID=348720 RepID=A0A8S4QVJ6_9NEOP|nr:jg11555 [Pararge aegeria aegeria]